MVTRMCGLVSTQINDRSSNDHKSKCDTDAPPAYQAIQPNSSVAGMGAMFLAYSKDPEARRG
jgi:hypothetical protein